MLSKVVLSLSLWETDDENTRAMLLRCYGAFVVNVEEFSSQFNSIQILFYIMLAILICFLLM